MASRGPKPASARELHPLPPRECANSPGEPSTCAVPDAPSTTYTPCGTQEVPVLGIRFHVRPHSASEGELSMLRRRGMDGPQQAAPAVNRYQMREKLVSIGEDYFIENERGQRVYKVDGKALRVRNTLILEDLQGRELASIQEKMLRVRDTMDIERGGQVVATVKKAMIT